MLALSPWLQITYHVGEKHVGRVAELVLNRDENRSGFNRIAVIGYAHNPENEPENEWKMNKYFTLHPRQK